jgi:hypothetical protein
VVHRLDIRPVRIEDVRAVVARVIRALSRRSVVAAAGCERSVVEAVDGLAIGCLEREVESRRDGTVVADEELVGREPALAFTRDPEPERLECAGVEPLARVDVGDPEVNVVEKAAPRVLLPWTTTLAPKLRACRSRSCS